MKPSFTKQIVLAEWPPRRGSKVGRALEWAKRINDARPTEGSAESFQKACSMISSALIGAMYQAHEAQKLSRVADSLSAKERTMLLDAVRYGRASYRGAGGWNTKRGLSRKGLLFWYDAPTRLGRQVAKFIGDRTATGAAR